MGHCIQAIIAPSDVADAIRQLHPQLRRVRAPQNFAILPVDGDFVEAVCHERPPQCTETFVVLTSAFGEYLLELSRLGKLAYVETEYFGGAGGQGAAVYSDRQELMAPEWKEFGCINSALRLLGVSNQQGGDCFTALGLGRFRRRDDLMDAADDVGDSPDDGARRIDEDPVI
jgi:hypothetical protein